MKDSLFNKIQNNIQNSPEARNHIRRMSWLCVLGSLLPLIIGLVTREHPNPFLMLSLIFMGMGGVFVGVSSLLFLRQSRIAGWLMLLGWLFMLLFLYFLARTLLYS